MSAPVLLSDLCDSGFGRSTKRDLSAALAASADRAGEHLIRFIRGVSSWLENRPEGRGWVEKDVNSFLSALGPVGLRDAVEALGDPLARAELLVLLAVNGPRGSLVPAAELVIDSLARGAPEEAPGNMDVWAQAARRVVVATAHFHPHANGHPVDLLAGALRSFPRWLVTELFHSLGKVPRPGFCLRYLAVALVIEPTAAPAFAQAWAAGGPQHLSKLLRQTCSSGKQKKADPRRPPAPAVVRKGLEALSEALSALDPAFSQYFENAVASWQTHDEDLPELFAEYLNATPRNHEDVIDFCSFTGSIPKDYPFSAWGFPAVYTATHTSILSSAGQRGAPWRDAPDFPAKEVLNRVSAESAIWLVRQQRSPRLALDYLSMFNHPPHAEWDIIAGTVLSSDWFSHRLLSATGVEAAAVLQRLENIRHSAARGLFENLFPELLPRAPSNCLGLGFGWIITDSGRDLMAKDAVRRIEQGPELDELDDIVEYSANLGLLSGEELEKLLASLDVAKYSPHSQSHQDHDKCFWVWARANTRLEPLLDNALDSMELTELSQLLAHSCFRRPDDPDSLDSLRLRNRCRVLAAVARQSPELAQDCVEREEELATIEFVRSGLEQVDRSQEFLRLVEDYAPSRWVHYAVNLLAAAVYHEGRERTGFLARVGMVLSSGLQRVGCEAQVELWQNIAGFVDKQEGLTTEGLAKLGYLDLPSDETGRLDVRRLVVENLIARRESGGCGTPQSFKQQLIAALDTEPELQKRARLT